MGGGHGDHHHHPVIGETEFTKVPDWRIYKIEDVPELVTNQRVLAQKGLKDPWARNHVWKYTRTDYWLFGKKMSDTQHFFRACTRNIHWGFAAAAVTITGEYLYAKFFLTEEERRRGPTRIL